MTRAASLRWLTAATAVACAAVAVIAWAGLGPANLIADWEVPITGLDLVPVVLGWLVFRAVATTPVAAALAWTGAATVAVRAVEVWGLSANGNPWPLSGAVAVVAPGVWPWQLMGFLVLLLVFPSGLLPGRWWRTLAVGGPVAALMITVALAGGDTAADELPVGWRTSLLLFGMALLLAVLAATVASLVVRYRRGDAHTRRQLRWLLFAGASVPLLLAASWFAVELGMPGPIAYSGFLIGMLVLVPAAVTLAIVHHDLFEIDQLITGSVAWLLTSVVSAAIFAVAVWVFGTEMAGPSGLGAAGAAFVTALCLLPVHARLHRAVGRLLDRERTVVVAAVDAFVEQVRAGTDQPERVEEVLRAALDDPGLRLALAAPAGSSVGARPGAGMAVGDEEARIALHNGEIEIGALLLGRVSARRRRLAIVAAQAARLPIEVSRLRLELRRALADVTASRSRLVAGVADERRRLERELHDGAQQRVVAVGMRLRSAQRRLHPDDPVREELDQAVAALEVTIAELRSIAHGVRPRQLDDGLDVALRNLATTSPVPLELDVGDLAVIDVDETRTITAYLVVAEALANTWKHASAQHVTVVARRHADQLHVEVTDDGCGGVDPATGLTALRDRVASVAGTLDVVSPSGGGTRITAVI